MPSLRDISGLISESIDFFKLLYINAMGTVDRLEATTDKCTTNLKNCYTLRIYMYRAEPHQVVDELRFSAPYSAFTVCQQRNTIQSCRMRTFQ